MAQSLHQTNRDILAALATVLELPDASGIRDLTLTMGATFLPELRLTTIVRLPRGEAKAGLFVKENDTRYRLVPIEQDTKETE